MWTNGLSTGPDPEERVRACSHAGGGSCFIPDLSATLLWPSSTTRLIATSPSAFRVFASYSNHVPRTPLPAVFNFPFTKTVQGQSCGLEQGLRVQRRKHSECDRRHNYTIVDCKKSATKRFSMFTSAHKSYITVFNNSTLLVNATHSTMRCLVLCYSDAPSVSSTEKLLTYRISGFGYCPIIVIEMASC